MRGHGASVYEHRTDQAGNHAHGQKKFKHQRPQRVVSIHPCCLHFTVGGLCYQGMPAIVPNGPLRALEQPNHHRLFVVAIQQWSEVP